MIAVEVAPNTFSEWNGERMESGVLLNPFDADRLSAADLFEAYGLLKVHEPEIPVGKKVANYTIERVSGLVTKVNVLVPDTSTTINVLSAPAVGFGGPTAKELFHGNR